MTREAFDELERLRAAGAAVNARDEHEVKPRLEVPDHLEVRQGRIADLEEILTPPSTSA